MHPSDLDLLCLAARINLRLSDWREVEALGLSEMARGNDIAEIVALASVSTGVEHPELVELLKTAVANAGMSYPDRRQSEFLAAVQIAEQILAGRVKPLAGAIQIGTLPYREQPDKPSRRDSGDPCVRLLEFFDIVDDWNEFPEARPEMERQVGEAARQLVSDYRPR